MVKTTPSPLILLGLVGLLAACGIKGKHEPFPLVELLPSSQLIPESSLVVSENSEDQFRIYRPYRTKDELFVVTASGELYKFLLREQGLEHLFMVDLGQDIYAGVTVFEDTIYVCVADSLLWGLSATDGQFLWQKELSDYCVAPPIVVDELVYLRLSNDAVIALDLEGEGEGEKVKWSYSPSPISLSLDGNAPLLLHNDALFFAADTSQLFSLSPRNGDLYWETRVGVPEVYTEIGLILDADAPLAVWRDYVIASAYQSRTLALNSLTGRELWQRKISTRHAMVVDSARKRLYISDIDGVLHCLKVDTGKTIWSSDLLSYRTLSSPALLKDVVVVGDREGFLHTFAVADGDYIGRQRIHFHDTDRDSITRRVIPGRYTPLHEPMQLFMIDDARFIAQDLSGRFTLYRAKY